MAQGHKRATVNATGCGFDFHSIEKLNIQYFHLYAFNGFFFYILVTILESSNYLSFFKGDKTKC